MGVNLRHGGNCKRLQTGLSAIAVANASASLAPWSPRCPRLSEASLRDYPDREQGAMRKAIAAIHGGLLIGCSLVMVLPSCSLGLPGMLLRPGSVVCSLQVLPTTGGPSDVGMLNGWRRHWGCLGITLVRLTTLP